MACLDTWTHGLKPAAPWPNFDPHPYNHAPTKRGPPMKEAREGGNRKGCSRRICRRGAARMSLRVDPISHTCTPRGTDRVLGPVV